MTRASPAEARTLAGLAKARASRGNISIHGTTEDYRNALTFAETLSGIDKKRTGIWGISYSGGHVLVTAAWIHAGIRNFNDSGGRWIPDHATRSRECAICAIE